MIITIVPENPVVAFIPGESIIPSTTVNCVVAIATGDEIVAIVPPDLIVAGTTVNFVSFVCSDTVLHFPIDSVVTAEAQQSISTQSTADDITANAAEDRVNPLTTDQNR